MRAHAFRRQRVNGIQRHLAPLVAVFLLATTTMSELRAAPTAASDPHFAVTGFSVTGNTLVDGDSVSRALAPFIRPDADFALLRQAVQAVEKLYADKGYSAVRVRLPEQDIDQGVVRIEVVEAHLGRIKVEGNQHFSTENILAEVPMLVPGEPPNVGAAARAVDLANENYAKQTRLLFGRGDTDATVDAVLKVNDVDPWRFIGLFDNTGTAGTGAHRIGVIGEYANMFGLDHLASFQAVTSPEYPDRVRIFGLGYKIPLYSLGDSVEFAYAHSTVSSGSVTTVAGAYGISGAGQFISAKYNLRLPNIGDIGEHAIFSYERHTFESQVVPEGGSSSLVPNLTSAPVGAVYALNATDPDHPWSADAGIFANTSSGSEGTTAAYDQPGARPGAHSDFVLGRWHGDVVWPIWQPFQLHARTEGQYTHDLLIPGEQFGIGGANSVRGFDERSVLGDRGEVASLEVQAGPFPAPYATQLQPVVFYDAGRVNRNQPQPGEIASEQIGSGGFGVRAAWSRYVQMRADLARVFQGGSTRKPGDLMLHVQLLVTY